MSLAAVVIAAKTDAIDVVVPTPIARTVLPHLDVQRVRSLRGECDGGADRFKHTGRVDPPAFGPRGHLVLRARAQLHPRLVRQGVVERVEKFLTCRTRFAPWKLSLIPRMPRASGRTPTSLRCRCGPGSGAAGRSARASLARRGAFVVFAMVSIVSPLGMHETETTSSRRRRRYRAGSLGTCRKRLVRPGPKVASLKAFLSRYAIRFD